MSKEARRLSDEDKNLCRHFSNRGAYYYALSPIGCEPVDILLGAVNWSGKRYHHTEGWGDPSEHATTGDGSCVDIITAAAHEVADYIGHLEHAQEVSRRRLDELTAFIRGIAYNCSEAARSLDAEREP